MGQAAPDAVADALPERLPPDHMQAPLVRRRFVVHAVPTFRRLRTAIILLNIPRLFGMGKDLFAFCSKRDWRGRLSLNFVAP
jgi:hypothetical protein